MYDDREIDRLRRALQEPTAVDRIPKLIELARHLCNRWASSPSSPQAESDNTEAAGLLREAQGMLRRGDILRAHVSYMLGMLLAGRAFLRGGTERQDNAERDEAIECLQESVEHPDQAPANRETALAYLAMLLMVRAIPPGAVGGLSTENLLPPNPAMIANLRSYFQVAADPSRTADLDRAEALLRQLQANPPVNPQIHQMGSLLLTQVQALRVMFGGGSMADLFGALSRMTGMWRSATGAAGNNAGPYGVPLAGFLGGAAPGAAGLSGLRGGLAPVVFPQLTAATTADGPVAPEPRAEPARPVERSEQVRVEIDPQDEEAVLALAREQGVDVQVLQARGLEPVTAIGLVLLGSARAVSAVVDLVERRKGGQVVDLRGGSGPTLYRSRDLQYGIVLLLTPDGQVRVEVREPRGTLSQVIDAIRRLLTDLVDRTGDVVCEVLDRTVGDRATVRRLPD